MIWTGRQADALRRALGMTYEQFAGELGVAVRTVAYWHSRPDSKVRDPRPLEQLYDTLSTETYTMREVQELMRKRDPRRPGDQRGSCARAFRCDL